MSTRRRKDQPRRRWIGNYPSMDRAEEAAWHLNSIHGWEGRYYSAGPPKVVPGHPETKDMGGLYEARSKPKGNGNDRG